MAASISAPIGKAKKSWGTRTTQLYDRRSDDIMPDEVEPVLIQRPLQQSR